MSDAYHAAFFSMAKKMLPDWLFRQVQSSAIPKSGGNARWKLTGPSVFERMAIQLLRPDRLKKLDDEELADVIARLNQMYKGAKRSKQKTDSFVKAASWVVSEMKDREISVDEKLAIIQDMLSSEVEKDYGYAAAGGEYCPKNKRGLTVEETLYAVSEELGRKYTKEEAGYEERSDNSYNVCGSCWFYRRGEGEMGNCMVVEGEIPWYATSEYHISSSMQAGSLYERAELKVREQLMDAAMGILKSSDMSGSDDDNNTDPKKPKMVIVSIKEMVQKRIKREGDEWVVTDNEGKKVLGRHKDRASAIRQLQAIEARRMVKEAIEKQITKRGNEYVVTHDGKVMGKSKDRAGAVRLLAAVMAGKKRKKEANKEDEECEKGEPTLSQVEHPTSRKRKRREDLLYKEDFSLSIPIAKIDTKKQKIYGIVLEPDEVDSQDDTITAEEIEKAAEGFMKRSRVIGERHRKAAQGVVLTDSYVTQGPTKLGKDTLKPGTWIIGVKVIDRGLWSRIESGEFNGFSVGGKGNRIKLA